MLTLMTTLATVTSLDRQSVDWKYAIKFTAAVTMGIIIAIGFMPKKETVDGVETTVYGLMKYRDRFWIYAAIAMVSLALLTYVIYLLKKDRKKFLRICSLCLSCVILVYSIYIITLGKTQSYSTHEFIIPYVINGGDRLELDDIQEVRSDFYETMDNLGMFWQIPTIQAFHSVVPGSVMQFYPSVGVTRDVGSRPEVKYFGLRSFLSVKYLFDYSGKGDDGNFKNYDGTTKMPGYVYYDNQNSYDIWENLYYIPYGFTFDYYMTESQFMECPEDTRHLLLLKALVVPDEDEGKYDGIMKQADSYSDFTYTDSQYFKDCEERREVACNYFEHDNDGFSAKIDLTDSKSRLVFFSVPYEDGWTAYVNGVETEIQKSSIGFMSVLCEGGKSSDIRFVYNVPGLKAGAAVTLVCIVLYGAYLVIIIKKGKFKNNTKKYRVVSADINSDIALTSKKINGILQNTQSVRTEINRQNRAENGEITFENQTEQNTEQQLGNTELNQNAADAQNKIGFDNSEDGLTEKKVSDNINTNTDVETVQTDVLNNERQNGTSDNKTDE